MYPPISTNGSNKPIDFMFSRDESPVLELAMNQYSYEAPTPTHLNVILMLWTSVRFGSTLCNAEHVRNNKCFICHQVGCNIYNHKKDVQKPHARK